MVPESVVTLRGATVPFESKRLYLKLVSKGDGIMYSVKTPSIAPWFADAHEEVRGRVVKSGQALGHGQA